MWKQWFEIGKRIRAALRPKRRITLAVMCMVVCLAGCSGNGNTGSSLFGKQELPSDTPWNHAPYAIMETENGWYTSSQTRYICMRYYDKESGNTILLCNKPECMHEGNDQCVATYNHLRVINSILYEGYIYLYGAEGVVDYGEKQNDTDVVSLCIWRVALDGSTIDKIGTVIEAENTQNQTVNYPLGMYGSASQDNNFIIHQGYAYIPYYLQFGTGQIGFKGGGIMKMDLSTGKTEDIYKMDAKINGIPYRLSAFDDTLYFYRRATNSVGRQFPLYRYSISEKTLEPLDLTYSDPEITVHGKKHEILETLTVTVVISKDRVYALARGYEEEEAGVLSILAFDSKTGSLVEEDCHDTEVPFDKKSYKNPTKISGNYSFMICPEGLLVSDAQMAYLFDFSGKITAQIPIPRELLGIQELEKQLIIDFKISNDKLYLIYGNRESGYYYRVLYCPMEDVYQGNITWTDAYRIQGLMTYEKYQEIIMQVQ